MIKRASIFGALLLLTSAQLSAEIVTPIGYSDRGNSPSIKLETHSTLIVTLDVECERIEVGKYAAFAQKFLGIRVPLADKTSYTIVDSSVALAPADFYVASEQITKGDSYEELSSSSQRVPIDVTSAEMLPTEEAAEAAANAIFEIRQLRRDLLTGELGEGFFGGGLGAALDRLQWEEEQYAELFYGRTIRSRSSHTRYIALNGTEPRYIVTRFSESGGVAAVADLAADPLLLQLTPDAPREITVPPIGEKSRLVKFWVENQVRCDLFFNSKLLTTKSIPLTEFGREIVYPISDK